MVSVAAGAAQYTCGRCQRPLMRFAYEMRGPTGVARRDLHCALCHPPLMRRSLVIAIIVGTVLTAINQGNVIARGDAALALAWKIPLTYAVPYCVATTGALLNARSKVRRTTT